MAYLTLEVESTWSLSLSHTHADTHSQSSQTRLHYTSKLTFKLWASSTYRHRRKCSYGNITFHFREWSWGHKDLKCQRWDWDAWACLNTMGPARRRRRKWSSSFIMRGRPGEYLLRHGGCPWSSHQLWDSAREGMFWASNSCDCSFSIVYLLLQWLHVFEISFLDTVHILRPAISEILWEKAATNLKEQLIVFLFFGFPLEAVSRFKC